jgi:hypothetical protein
MFLVKESSRNGIYLDYNINEHVAYPKPGKLYETEQQISESVQKVIGAKLDVCVALAKIKIEKLYKEIGIATFKDYIKVNRIAIRYQTAHDYAKIGEIYIKYRDNLESVNFKEENGLKKLLLLEDALTKYKNESDLVFDRLKRDSYREFKLYCAQTAQSARADYQNLQLTISEECIVIRPYDKELLWFDPEINNWFESPGQSARFKQYILRAMRQYLLKNSMRLPH